MNTNCNCKEKNRFFGTSEVKVKERDLDEMASRDMGWTFLLKCKLCGMLWELTYPQSEYHGGGPPELTKIDDNYVKKNYPMLNLTAKGGNMDEKGRDNLLKRLAEEIDPSVNLASKKEVTRDETVIVISKDGRKVSFKINNDWFDIDNKIEDIKTTLKLKIDGLKMDKITIKQSVLCELLKQGDIRFKEALKMGELNIVDDVSGKVIGKISM